MLKKIISAILSVTILSTFVCVSVSASSEDSITKQKLGKLIQIDTSYYSTYGHLKIYNDYNVYQAYLSAKDVYESETSKETAYKIAYEVLLEEHHSMDIFTDYAKKTLELAEKERNNKEFYSGDDWNEYQLSVTKLREALNDYDDTNIGYDIDPITNEIVTYTVYVYNNEQKREITNAFHALLKSYNTMTNKNAIKGDVDGNGKVDVDDATLVQKYLAEEEKLTGAQKMRACVSDSDRYDKANISDVTAIQKYAAGLVTEFPNHQIFVSDIESYESEDYLMSRLINLNICPKYSSSGSTVQNGYYDSERIKNFYRWCEENGIEP